MRSKRRPDLTQAQSANDRSAVGLTSNNDRHNKGALFRARLFFSVDLRPVVLGDLAAVIDADAGADHAHYESGGYSDSRPNEPASVAEDCRTKEGKELAHTGWTIGASPPSLHGGGILRVKRGSGVGGQQEVHQSDERQGPPQARRHHPHLPVTGVENQGEKPEEHCREYRGARS